MGDGEAPKRNGVARRSAGPWRPADGSAGPGSRPLGRFLAEVNWGNEPRPMPSSDALPVGSWPLRKLLAAVNWTNAMPSGISGDGSSPSALENAFADFVWD